MNPLPPTACAAAKHAAASATIGISTQCSLIQPRFSANRNAAFTLIWELSPAAFMSPPATTDDLGELATMLYFNLTTLTTTGYGDIVPVDPFARSLANLESVLGPFYLAITVARLVTLEVEDRHR